MQLPESLYFSGSCIPANESLLILLALSILAQTVQDYILILRFWDLRLS